MTRSEPRWLGRMVVDEAHFRQIREHGGSHGVRDESVLESALARPQQRWHHEPDSPLHELAAAYGYGLARNHAYADGNKRVAFVVMAAFLDRNGIELTATNEEALAIMLRVAEGSASEADLTAWLAAHTRPQGA